MNFIAAVPPLVNCAFPIECSASHCAAASQNKTRPLVNFVEPAVTLDVSVTAVLEATVTTELPAVVIVRLVDVVAGAAFTFTVSGVEPLTDPDVPVIVAVVDPGVADWLTARVSVLTPVVGLEENDPVTPLGSPAIARATLPLKPF
jgi:hypothetical protein